MENRNSDDTSQENYGNVAKDEIAIFMDIITTGSTGEAILTVLKRDYPAKTLFETDKSQLPPSFVPSKRIQKELTRSIR